MTARGRELNESSEISEERSHFFQECYPCDNYIQSIVEDSQNNIFQIAPSPEIQISSLVKESDFLNSIEPIALNNENLVGQQAGNPNQINDQRLVVTSNQINNMNIINSSFSNLAFTRRIRRRGTKYFSAISRGLFFRKIMNNIRKSSYYISGYKLQSPNFDQQFGGNSNAKNKRFLKLKIYQYFSYDTFYKNSKNDRKTGSNNLKIIKKIVFEKKNQAYIALMSSTIEEMYERFIKNEDFIEKNGKIYRLPNFKTINHFIKDLYKNKVLSDEEIQDEIYSIKNMVDYIKKGR